MLTTYEAVLRGNTIEWRGESPHSTDAAVNVHVTVLSPPAPVLQQGQRMAEALERIAQSSEMAGVDAAAWEREERAERPLPGRSG
jgi:hypothetical protein